MGVECDTFQCHKGETTLLLGLLEPLPIPTRIWTYISMDFIEGPPKSGAKTMILVVVYCLSKYNDFRHGESFVTTWSFTNATYVIINLRIVRYQRNKTSFRIKNKKILKNNLNIFYKH